jgi:nucleoside-diphosphate-sugar epimerase
VCNDPGGLLNPQATSDINHLASVPVAEKAEAGVERFLFASSCSLYGEAGDDEVLVIEPVAPCRA